MKEIKKIIKKSSSIFDLIWKNDELIDHIEIIVSEIVTGLQAGKKVLFCGNGGSAAQAQHLAAELSGKFYIDREPVAAEACHVNPSFMTAVSNDYSFDNTYSRYVKAFAQKNDILIGLSTSGNSKNIVEAFKTANEIGVVTVALTGESGGNLKQLSNHILAIPSDDVPRIQEAHLLLGHIICELVENKLFGE